MIKIIGALLLCLSAGTYGFCMAGELKEKVSLLEEWKRCLLMLKGEIRFGNAMLPEAFLALGKRASEPFASFLEQIGETLQSRPDLLLSQVWQEQAENLFQKSVFSEEEVNWFSEMGSQLGYLDKEMQLGTLKLLIEQTEAREQVAEKKLSDNAGMYRCVGTMSGILAAILLY